MNRLSAGCLGLLRRWFLFWGTPTGSWVSVFLTWTLAALSVYAFTQGQHHESLSLAFLCFVLLVICEASEAKQ